MRLHFLILLQGSDHFKLKQKLASTETVNGTLELIKELDFEQQLTHRLRIFATVRLIGCIDGQISLGGVAVSKLKNHLSAWYSLLFLKKSQMLLLDYDAEKISRYLTENTGQHYS